MSFVFTAFSPLDPSRTAGPSSARLPAAAVFAFGARRHVFLDAPPPSTPVAPGHGGC